MVGETVSQILSAVEKNKEEEGEGTGVYVCDI